MPTRAPKPVRPRPPLFRALGPADPPAHLHVANQPYHLVDTFKHDSFAATALYQHDASSAKIVCKFNRAYPILGLPAAWIGRWLANRERRALVAMAHHPLVPSALAPVTNPAARDPNAPMPTAIAHTFVPGHPLARRQSVSDEFFSLLNDLLNDLHSRHLAYVDLNKRENILLGDDGRPYLIDFQIHFALPRLLSPRRWPGRSLLTAIQNCDRYHLLKHQIALRPDQVPHAAEDLARLRPWPIRFWRLVGTPLRQLRRKLLVAVGVRSGSGRADSELNPEHAVRQERGADAASPPTDPPPNPTHQP